MLRMLTLRNFRAIQHQIDLRLRPITVLIGRNNAGKSSVLKFLSMLRQSLESDGPHFLAPEGEYTHLGAFSHLKNRNSLAKYLRFCLELETDLPPGFRAGDWTSPNIKVEERDAKTTVTVVVTKPIGKKGEAQVPMLFKLRVAAPYEAGSREGTQELTATLNGEQIL